MYVRAAVFIRLSLFLSVIVYGLGRRKKRLPRFVDSTVSAKLRVLLEYGEPGLCVFMKRQCEFESWFLLFFSLFLTIRKHSISSQKFYSQHICSYMNTSSFSLWQFKNIIFQIMLCFTDLVCTNDGCFNNNITQKMFHKLILNQLINISMEMYKLMSSILLVLRFVQNF